MVKMKNSGVRSMLANDLRSTYEKEKSFHVFIALIEDQTDKKLVMFDLDTLNSRYDKKYEKIITRRTDGLSEKTINCFFLANGNLLLVTSLGFSVFSCKTESPEVTFLVSKTFVDLFGEDFKGRALCCTVDYKGDGRNFLISVDQAESIVESNKITKDAVYVTNRLDQGKTSLLARFNFHYDDTNHAVEWKMYLEETAILIGSKVMSALHFQKNEMLVALDSGTLLLLNNWKLAREFNDTRLHVQ